MLTTLRAGAFAGILVVAVVASSSRAADRMPTPEPWLAASATALRSPPPPRNTGDDVKALRATVAARTPEEVMRARWWLTGGAGYRWNEIALDTLLEEFVTLPLAARHLALIQAAVDDAVAAAWREKRRHNRARPGGADRGAKAVVPMPASPSYPSDHAAAAVAAAAVLGELLPSRAADIAARAEEAMRAPMIAGIEFPSDVAAGRAIGRAAAELAIARARGDGADAKWTGTVPVGPGLWQGTNPIAPLAGTWRPWLLARNDALRPPAPAAFDAPATRDELAELKAFARTPRTNHRANYWEVFGGARAHTLWNETLRAKLLENAASFDPPAATRAMAALNIAMADAGVACWDAKYAYWRIRPAQLDPELKTVFPAPNHPSYPAAHGCFSTAAATVMAGLFPADRDRLLAQGREAAEARVWAGIHFRSDIDAGQLIGRRVGEMALARAFAAGRAAPGG